MIEKNTVDWNGERFYIKENEGFKRKQHFVIKDNRYLLWWSPFEKVPLPNYYFGEIPLVDKKNRDHVKLRVKNGVITNMSFSAFQDVEIIDTGKCDEEYENRH